MLRRTASLAFYMKLGRMHVDYKVLSRDHKRSISVEEAVVDPCCPVTVLPLSWLEQLRSPSIRLPTGFYQEDACCYDPSVQVAPAGPARESKAGETPNAVRAGPVVLYVVGQPNPIVLYPYFVPDGEIRYAQAASCPSAPGEVDLRLGMDAIEQCGLFNELRPGGYLYRYRPSASASASASAGAAPALTISQLRERLEPLQAKLKRDYGMKDARLAHSPLVPRPWTRMKYMFIDELQRGPRMTEFVGFNPRNGSPWRFSQHTKFFRQGIWRETTRRNEMNDGLHAHSSWQKSPQQAVPDVNFMAPYP